MLLIVLAFIVLCILSTWNMIFDQLTILAKWNARGYRFWRHSCKRQTEHRRGIWQKWKLWMRIYRTVLRYSIQRRPIFRLVSLIVIEIEKCRLMRISISYRFPSTLLRLRDIFRSNGKYRKANEWRALLIVYRVWFFMSSLPPSLPSPTFWKIYSNFERSSRIFFANIFLDCVMEAVCRIENLAAVLISRWNLRCWWVYMMVVMPDERKEGEEERVESVLVDKIVQFLEKVGILTKKELFRCFQPLTNVADFGWLIDFFQNH